MNCPTFFAYEEENAVLCLVTGDKAAVTNCFNDKLKELDPSKSEGAGEKHLPMVNVNGTSVTVNVGSVLHPMTKEHSIGWIYLETEQGGQIQYLSPDMTPAAEFILSSGDRAIAAYAYCNLHGFWKTAI